jgi:secondary thiamine-phosphate synthase enzyme
MFSHEITIETGGNGLYEFTNDVSKLVIESGVNTGLCHLFIKHTSAGLIIQENADPTARRDLEEWMRRLVPENQSWFTHTLEGPDDMPGHIRSVLTGCSLCVPVHNGKLGLGTWQGIYLWEHRRTGYRRKIQITVMG